MRNSARVTGIVLAGFMLLVAHSHPALSGSPDVHQDHMTGGSGMPPGMDHQSMGMDHSGMGAMRGHGYGGEEGAHWMKPHNAAVHFLEKKELLGLSEKQTSDLKGLRDAYRAENTVNEAKLKSAEEELREILEEDSVNVQRAEAMVKEIGALQGSLWTSFIRQLASIKTIIPRDQMKKMHEMKGPHPMMEKK